MSKNDSAKSYTYTHNGRTVVVGRVLDHTAYPRNGNTGRATKYYRWITTVDGVRYGTEATRREAKAFGFGIIDGIYDD